MFSALRNSPKCPRCSGQSYIITKQYLKDDETLAKGYKCYECRFEWEELEPLLHSDTKYHYIWLPESKTSMQLSRWVWEQKHNCKLPHTAVIHHINRNRSDDRLTNLELTDAHHHNGLHERGITCRKCGHKWIPRQSTVRICARCKSPYWDTPRTRRGAFKEQDDASVSQEVW